MASIPSLQEFDISPVSGFVPEKEPLQCLPDYFSPWENIARSLPHLVKDGGRFRQIIKQLPVLEHNRLSSEDEWKRAKLVLACISHAYVWCKGEAGAAKILPKCLAVPWAAVAKHLGIPPIMSHCNYALYNWRYIDPSRKGWGMVKSETRRDTETLARKSETETKHARLQDQNKCTTNETSRLFTKVVEILRSHEKFMRPKIIEVPKSPPLVVAAVVRNIVKAGLQ